MKKLISAAIAGMMLLSLTACGSSGQTGSGENNQSQAAASEEADQETAVPEAVETADSTQDYEPVAVNEVVYDDNGIRITYVDYRKISEEDLNDGDKALKVNLKVEKTADHVDFSPIKTTVNGWLTSDSIELMLHPVEIPDEGKELSLSIRRSVLENYKITDVAEVGYIFAVKTDDHYVVDHIKLPVFPVNQAEPVKSTTEGFYQPGVLVKISNGTSENMVACYLVKCKDGEGHQLVQQNMMSMGEFVDGSFAFVKIRAGASDMPAAIKAASSSEWEYAGNYCHDFEMSDATAELIFVYPDYMQGDVSDQVTATEVVRKDSHLYGYIGWPDDLGKLDVYGTVMRYQNGELKSVTSASSNAMDPAKDENFLYFENYDYNYDNETFEMVINAALQLKD
ncbi:MAG: hypothetical protein K6F23_08405 [Solobacterium sp.]|nr:hypothetical protein [Solobacterium sp.]